MNEERQIVLQFVDLMEKKMETGGGVSFMAFADVVAALQKQIDELTKHE